MNNSRILLLDKIYYLGKRLEKHRTYTLLDPWNFKSNDPLEVQKAGKKISNFIGLQNLTFVVTYSSQKKGVGGHIELNNNSNEGVFIEIDDKFRDNYEIVLAILAHEICHKLIHINGLTQFGYENEILTDVATVYTGLGKLSLNGCETITTKTDTIWDVKSSTKTGTNTTTTTQKVGYLERHQFAFVYKAVCRMRRIPETYMLDYLSRDSIKALNNVPFVASEELFYNESAINLVSETIKNKLDKLQVDFALNYKAQKTLKHSLESVLELYITSHSKIKAVSEKLRETARKNHEVESLNFLKNVILISELETIDEKFTIEENEFSSLNSMFMSWINDLSTHRQTTIKLDVREYLYSIECPICRSKMNLKQDKLVKVKCPNCKYSFIIDNTKFERIKVVKSKESLQSKIKEIISIIKR